ncbi:hypothetical protein ANO14919_007740 [Xylariales sp. No.14919]|nr:hypothetical protein ANO14919_007740 [Xylariales sp. No.14919]
MATDSLYILNESVKNDIEKETARLELQHRFFDDAMNNELLPPHIMDQLAEIPSPRVCEIAAGTAIWLKELAKTLPASAELVGLDFDVSKFPEPEALPSNISLGFVDAYEPFPMEYQNRFDVVHLRHFILATKKDHGVLLVQNLLSLLRPGGWLVWVEAGAPLASAEPPSEALFQVQKIYYNFIKAAGLEIDATLARASYMRQAGLVDCEDRSYNCGSVLFGPKASGWLVKAHEEFALTFAQIMKGILVKGGVEGLRTPKDLNELAAKLREDFSGTRRLHIPVVRTSGRKPS